jgi:hypothetical protein
MAQAYRGSLQVLYVSDSLAIDSLNLASMIEKARQAAGLVIGVTRCVTAPARACNRPVAPLMARTASTYGISWKWWSVTTYNTGLFSPRPRRTWQASSTCNYYLSSIARFECSLPTSPGNIVGPPQLFPNYN